MDVREKNLVNYFNELIFNELNGVKIYCWIAGGILRNYYSGKPLNTDVDLFFANHNTYQRAEKYFSNDRRYEQIHETENALKFKRDDGLIVDVIKKIFDDPRHCIGEFDFTICQLALDVNGMIYLGEHTLFDLSRHQLMINKILYPYSTLHRLVRYMGKGFNICMGELDKIHDAIQNTSPPETENSSNENNEEVISSSRGGGRFHFD